VIEPRCSLGSPGVEFVEGSSEGKVEETPEYVPTSPSVDWNAVADKMAVDPYDCDCDIFAPLAPFLSLCQVRFHTLIHALTRNSTKTTDNHESLIKTS
jgi:hypothetical protein